MIPGVRIMPVERAIERDGVTVVLSHAAMLTAEAMLWHSPQPLNQRDILKRVHGSRWGEHRFETARVQGIVTEMRRALMVLGIEIVRCEIDGWAARDAA
jgi:hypothetical protein